MNNKLSLRDIGWMYQPPAMTKKTDKVRAPPLSTIPGLGTFTTEENTEDNDPYLRWINPTDTPYTILCKEGGRKGLLCFKENVFDKNAPKKPYPRPDWIDWPTPSQENDESTEIYKPKLPDFMVHDAKPHPIPLLTGARRKQRPTLASDFPLGISIGRHKTMHNIDVPPPPRYDEPRRQGLETIRREKPEMSKMLAHSYAKEYEMVRKEYHKLEVENIEKAKKEEGKYDPYKFRRNGNKGYAGKARKPKQIIGGW